VSSEVRPEWDVGELRAALLRYAAGSDEITVEEAVRALILEVGKQWPEFVETAGVIDPAGGEQEE
jgi:hypothetical protein